VGADESCEDSAAKKASVKKTKPPSSGWVLDRVSSYAPSWLLAGVAVAGLAFGAAFWLLKNGRPRRLELGVITEDVARRIVKSARTAVERMNDKMRGGLSDGELAELQVFYERWLNLENEMRTQLREELAREGVDMIKLGDALRVLSDEEA
jgi:hypothetical protein